MSKQKDGKWECGNCRTREESPISEECPGCGLRGHRFPLAKPASQTLRKLEAE